MARVVGFSLKLEGRAQTIADLDAIERKLTTVTLAIQAAQTAGQNGGSQAGQNKAVKELTIELVREQQARAALRKELKNQIIESDILSKKIQPGSIIALRFELSKLKEEYIKLAGAARKGAEGVALLNKIQGLDARIKREEASMGVFVRNVGNYKQALLSVGSLVTGGLLGAGIVGAVNVIGASFQRSFQNAKQFSDIQADVRKTTGLTKQEISALSEEFKKFNTRTASSELLKIAVIAGQLGISGKDDIKEFTKAIDVLVVALGDELSGGAERITQDVGRLSNVLFGATTDGKLLADNILHIGNTLNVLSSTSAATSENIINFATRIGSTLIPLGASADEVLALSATFDELNINAERGSTAINNLVKDIGADTSLFSKKLGLNQKELREQFNISPLEAFQTVLNKVLSISGGDKTKTLNLLKELKQTGIGVGDVFLQMATRSDIFDKNLSNAQIAIKGTSSLFNEFAVKNDTLAGVFDRLSKKMEDIGTNPKFIAAFEKIGNILLGLVSITSDAIAGIGEFFDRVAINTNIGGKKVESSFLGMNESALSMNESTFILTKGISDLNKMLIKEEAVIQNTIKTLRDESISRETKTKLIQGLLDKYPGLITKYELEIASNERLDEVQKILSATLRKEVFERIKLKTQEALETELINQRIRKAELEQGGGLSGAQGVLANFFGRADEVREIEKKNTDQAIKDAEEALKKSGSVFDNVAVQIGAQFAVRTEATYLQVRDNLTGLFTKIESDIDNNKIPAAVKNSAIKISEEATNLVNSLKTNASQVDVEKIFTQAIKLQQEYEKLIATTSKKGGDNLKSLGTDAKEAAKSLEDQLKRIQDLQDQFRKTQNDLLSDEFQKQIDNANLTFEINVRELEARITALKKDGITKTDAKEIAAIEAAILQAGQVRDAAIDKTNIERERTINEGIIKLSQQRDEIESLLISTGKLSTDSNVELITFDQDQQLRNIKISNEKQLALLDEKFAKGKISQELYNEQRNELEKQAASQELEILISNREKILSAYSEQYGSDLALLKANHKSRLNEIEIQKQKELTEIDTDLTSGKLGTGTNAIALAANLKNEVLKKANAQILEADKKLFTEQTALQNDLLTNQQAVADGIVDVTNTKNEATLESDRENVEKRIEILNQLKDAALDIAREVADTEISIKRDNLEAEFKAKNKNLEKERSARLKLAKGNATEEEKINREFDQKKEQLDREQFERQKELSILQVEIQTAIAIITALAQLGPIAGGIAGAIILIKAGLQISEIKSKSFAEGGWADGEGGHTGASQRLPDRTGKRPVGQAELHEKEYIAPDWQTDEHPELFEAFEEDRLNRKHGRSGAVQRYLSQRIKQYAESQAKYHAEMYQPRLTLLTTPIVVSPKEFYDRQRLEVSTTIPDEQMDRLADKIALRNAAASESGTEKGMEKGSLKAAEHKMRLERMNKNRTA